MFYAWRRKAAFTAFTEFTKAATWNDYASFAMARKAMRPWLRRVTTLNIARAMAEECFIRRQKTAAVRVLAALRTNVMTWAVASAAAAAMRARRQRGVRSRAYAAWTAAVAVTTTQLVRHGVMQQRRTKGAAFTLWGRRVHAAAAAGMECKRRVGRVARRELLTLTFQVWAHDALLEASLRRRVCSARERFTAGRAFRGFNVWRRHVDLGRWRRHALAAVYGRWSARWGGAG